MEKLHSKAYFGDQRDFWWHRDFIELMAKRWELNNVTTILDVGCGQGHWGLTLLPVLPPNCKLIGIDSEPKWVEMANINPNNTALTSKLIIKWPKVSFCLLTTIVLIW